MQIFSSKGDIGVTRNNKKESTVPMVTPDSNIFFYKIYFKSACGKNLRQHEVLVLSQEFNLHTERRAQHDPPVDLFNMVNCGVVFY